VPFVAPKLVAKRLVEVVLVPVAFVQVNSATFSGPVKFKFAMVALVANKFVVVALVDVVSVKTPVEGVILPICVPLIDPPEMVAFEEVKFGAFKVMMVPVSALIVVPEAVANPSQFVEVPSLKVKFEMVPLVVTKFVVFTSVALTVAMVPELKLAVDPVTELP
jgi:hypothetical protein